jgi:hypothetical protein
MLVLNTNQSISQVTDLLAHGRWFSPGSRASSTIKTGRHDIAEILLKVEINTKNQSIKQAFVIIGTNYLFLRPSVGLNI